MQLAWEALFASVAEEESAVDNESVDEQIPEVMPQRRTPIVVQATPLHTRAQAGSQSFDIASTQAMYHAWQLKSSSASNQGERLVNSTPPVSPQSYSSIGYRPASFGLHAPAYTSIGYRPNYALVGGHVSGHYTVGRSAMLQPGDGSHLSGVRKTSIHRREKDCCC